VGTDTGVLAWPESGIMIGKSEFQEQFKYYDREVVREIIDLFLQTYREKLELIHSGIEANDLEHVNMHAHSLKGLAGTFMAQETQALAAKMEETARNNHSAGLHELFDRLDASTHVMAGDLEAIRDEFYS
jgi:HPt (histidine-containing phosphotransfer) domain-containing protein